MKTCVRCGREKPLAEFHRQNGHTGGRRTVCKVCRTSKEGTIHLEMAVTWPTPIRNIVSEVANRLPVKLEHYSGGGELSEREDEFRALFAGKRLRAYHCTRLLPHEIEDVRRGGLRLLTEDLVRRRIEEATIHGYVSRQLGDELLQGHVFATREHDNREKRVCFFLSTNVLRERVGSVWYLMTLWGGEAISFSSRSSAFEEHLKNLGTPAVIVVDLDISDPHRTHHAWPGILHAFVAKYLGERDADADVHYTRNVEGTRVVDVWTPGHPRYDEFKELPR